MKNILFLTLATLLILSVCGQENSLHAGEFVPPTQIVSKTPLPIKNLNLVRTKEGRTYLISPDGRYVFQGDLFDVWNGVQVQSAAQFKAFSDRISFKHLGIEPEKMFTLDVGTGKETAFIFADPNCGVCHKLISGIMDSKLIQSRFHISIIITPLMNQNSRIKAQKLATLARKDPKAALDAFVKNTMDELDPPEGKFPKLSYNLLIAKALSIENIPYLINPSGRIHIGKPEDVFVFLSKQ